jgi:hypothetical protein
MRYTKGWYHLWPCEHAIPTLGQGKEWDPFWTVRIDLLRFGPKEGFSAVSPYYSEENVSNVTDLENYNKKLCVFSCIFLRKLFSECI